MAATGFTYSRANHTAHDAQPVMSTAWLSGSVRASAAKGRSASEMIVKQRVHGIANAVA